MPARKTIPTLEPIRADESYPISEFQKRTGLGKSSIRALRRSGDLKVRKVGSRHYVLGSDWNAYLSRAEVAGPVE